MRTFTRTATWARIELLRTLVRVVVRRLAPDPERTIRQAIDPGIEQELLRRVTFFGLDGRGVCHAKLTLAIDWAEHRRLNVVQGRLTLPGRPEEAAPELAEMLLSFERAIERERLHVRIGVSFLPGVDVRRARALLGLGAPRPIEWAGIPVSMSLAVKKLPELQVLIDLADEEDGRDD
jgi:hypothetical protein